MPKRIVSLLALVALVVFVPQPVATAGPKATLGGAAKALQKAAFKKKKLSAYFAERVQFVYRTSDRSEGTCMAKGEFSAKALDGMITLKGRVSGHDWIRDKKIVPHDKTVKLNLRKEAFQLLADMTDKARRCKDREANDRACLDKKRKVLVLCLGAQQIDFFWKKTKKGFVVQKIKYAIEDPG